jgi:hypothetical protein
MPVGIHPHLFVVGVGSPFTVPAMERLGARRGHPTTLRSAGSTDVGESHVPRAFKITIVRYQRQDLPLLRSDKFFKAGYYVNTHMGKERDMYLRSCLATRRVRTD